MRDQSRSRTTEYLATFRDGEVVLDSPVQWPDGTRLTVRVAELDETATDDIGLVIIAGFGLAGRWVADIFDRHDIRYVIVEQNPETVATQRDLGRNIVEGNISEPETLREAGINEASILLLTIPDEDAVLKAVKTARDLRPGIYIVARTTYSSAGMQAARLGADEVIKAEQAVARQFYEMLQRKLATAPPVNNHEASNA